ncbi:WhiB family transcriptional regulator [Actinomycetospora endophytica]|uniref:WhiB family transcriptional regulator n=1 Tax=Actinomycetospora endophytica TaxID=2291215 RepID=UPI003558C093
MSTLGVNTGWRARAACRDHDPELFFPTAHSGPARAAQAAAAKRVCAGCPVREACLRFALAHLPHGVAGGLDEDERRAVRRRGAVGRPVARPGPRVLARRARAGGCSAAQVAMWLGVSTRTVHRWTAGGAA